MRRGLLALLVLALAAPLAASAGSHDDGHAWSASYLAPSLQRAATQTPNASVPVIVQSLDGSGRAQNALNKFGTASSRLGIVDGAAGEVVAGDLPQLATANPGLVITPDQPVVLDAKPDSKSKNQNQKGNQHNPPPATGFSSREDWPAAVGVDQLWPGLASLQATRPKGSGTAPAIAFVDSGIDSSRADFAGRVLAQLDLSSLEDNSPGDGNGHGTLVAGLGAGAAPNHAGAAPTAGIVSLDVMDDQGMARTSDVIAAAQWILKNHRQYNIRVANFSLHAAVPTSFRWDPLDKAVEKLWFSGVVVVAASGNQAQGGQRTPMAYAPANDPFVITVGALDLHNSTNPDRADLAPWSAWGYTLDGFAKPELSAPGRAIVGPVPAGSTLAAEKPKQVVRTPEGTYMQLSGTSLSAPIVSGIAADLLALRPTLSPDQVKGALMLKARPLRKVKTVGAGVGEVYAPGAAAVQSPPNPNRALDAFLVPDPSDDGGGMVFDDVSWLDAAKASRSWDAVSWLDVSWSDASWTDVSWFDVSWSDVSWSDVSWSDVSWADVSWSDVSWADLTNTVYGDVAP
ncbi:MAG TPA: S8 family serine peptidase [Gaiellaceae bacterium]|nr:S8 family serine peptidase [Gaiellaceae bacterium]